MTGSFAYGFQSPVKSGFRLRIALAVRLQTIQSGGASSADRGDGERSGGEEAGVEIGAANETNEDGDTVLYANSITGDTSASTNTRRPPASSSSSPISQRDWAHTSCAGNAWG